MGCDMFSAKDWDDFCENRYKTQRARHCTGVILGDIGDEECTDSHKKKVSYTGHMKHGYEFDKENKC